MEFSRDNSKKYVDVDKFQISSTFFYIIMWVEEKPTEKLCWTTFLFLLLYWIVNSMIDFFLPHHHIFCRQNKVGGLEFQRRLKHLHNQQMLSSQPFFARSSSSVQMLRRIAEIFFLNCLNNGHTQRFLCFLGFFVLEVLPCFWNKIWLQRRTLFSTFL